MQEQLIIFDTTMRDGEQSPGAAMSRDEKVRIGKQLERLRVDVIEAGFAAASPGDFDAIRAVAAAVKDSTVCSLARANDNDVRRAGEAIKGANSGRVHTFIATSPIHMKHKLRMEPDQVVEAAVRAVKLARQYTDDVEFSPEDAVRSDVDFLCRVLEAAIAAGASTINVPDTVGYAVPHLWGELFTVLRNRIPNSDKTIWVASMRVPSLKTSDRVFSAITISSSEALPARSPRPLMVHSTWRAPAITAASELATAMPRSLWQ